MPLTPKFVFALWQNVNDLEMVTTKIKNKTGFFFVGDNFTLAKLHVSLGLLITSKKCHEVVQNSECSIDPEVLDYIPDFDIETKDYCES